MSFLDGKIHPVDILLFQKEKKPNKTNQNKVRMKHLLEHENGLL